MGRQSCENNGRKNTLVAQIVCSDAWIRALSWGLELSSNILLRNYFFLKKLCYFLMLPDIACYTVSFYANIILFWIIPIVSNFHRYCCFMHIMLRYTKWEDWSSFKCVQCLYCPPGFSLVSRAQASETHGRFWLGVYGYGYSLITTSSCFEVY